MEYHLTFIYRGDPQNYTVTQDYCLNGDESKVVLGDFAAVQVWDYLMAQNLICRDRSGKIIHYPHNICMEFTNRNGIECKYEENVL